MRELGALVAYTLRAGPWLVALTVVLWALGFVVDPVADWGIADLVALLVILVALLPVTWLRFEGPEAGGWRHALALGALAVAWAALVLVASAPLLAGLG